MEKNEYRLVISIDDSVSGGAVSEQGLKNTNKNNVKKAATLLTSYAVATPFINTTRQIIQNNVDTKYGSTELSARIGMGLSIVQMGAKTAVAVASGTSLASALGLSTALGGGVGVLVGLGMVATNIIVRQNELNNKIKLENQELNILRGRAGIQFNRSRGGE